MNNLPPKEVQALAEQMARQVLRWSQGDLPPSIIEKKAELERALENAGGLAILFNYVDVGAYRHVVGLTVELETILRGYHNRTLH